MADNINDMTFDSLVPSNSKYLQKDDVGEDGVILTIRGFKRETLENDDGNEEKIVLYFQEQDYKPMVVNRTNANMIANATGSRTAGESIGKQIVVYNDPTVQFAGKITGGLRIKKYSTAQPKQPQSARVPHSESIQDMESDRPY